MLIEPVFGWVETAAKAAIYSAEPLATPLSLDQNFGPPRQE